MQDQTADAAIAGREVKAGLGWDSGDELALSWAAALTAPLHTSNCGCCGGFAAKLTQTDLEAIILDYIDDQLPKMRTLTATRRTESGGVPFLSWIVQPGSGDAAASVGDAANRVLRAVIANNPTSVREIGKNG